MRSITTSLAALLSLLLISAPVSAWACDLSCSSHQARSDCHSSTATSKDDTAMSMPAGMDMGSDRTESPMGTDMVMNATPAHAMSMALQQEMSTQRLEQVSKLETRTGAMHDHSKSVSACTHETCSQVTASASPPGADHSQPNSLHRIAGSISSHVNLWIDSSLGTGWLRTLRLNFSPLTVSLPSLGSRNHLSAVRCIPEAALPRLVVSLSFGTRAPVVLLYIGV